MEKYLNPTYYIESEHPEIISFVNQNIKKNQTDLEKAVSIYYAVRDGIRYNPYSIEPAKKSMKASSVLKKGDGYCVAKAVLLAACARSQQIPARLGFADVQNHLNTGKRNIYFRGEILSPGTGVLSILISEQIIKGRHIY